MSRVFITGGGGFLANHLAARLLGAGHEVTVMARSARDAQLPEGARIVRGDLVAGGRPLMPARTDIVFHMAARSSVPESTADPRSTFDVNVMGTARLLEEVRTRKVKLERFVLASTALVYGPPFAGRIREDHRLLPRNPYAASKAAAEHYAFACADLYGIPVSVVRLFNVYGPGQRANFVIPTVLAQCLEGKQVAIGNPWPVRDFLHADDAVALFELAATKAQSPYEVVNAGSGKGTSIEAMVGLAMRATGARLKVSSVAVRRRSNDFDRLVADVGRAKRRFGWAPRVGLAEGLRRTADAMRSASQAPG